MKQNVRESNAWGADVHYVSHTNGSADGKAQGCHPMYYTYSKNGKKLGEIMVKYRKQIYPRTVKLVARSDLYELKKTNAVAFYEEHAFHDNMEDATWFHTHMEEIAESAAKGLCEYFGIPYVEPVPVPAPVEQDVVIPIQVRMLRRGMKGADVKTLQAALITYGFSCGTAGADGDFGSATYAALRKFQTKYGLGVDGIAGIATWSKLLGK